ncbi:DUF2911 domain-containing protein [bacterium]|nr:MAG: DUF2911 domain-containing protein [bacterium]
MKRFTDFSFWIVILSCLAIMQYELVGQEKEVRPSPPAKVSFNLNGNDIVIDYSSPSVKGREIWGKLVPFDKVWRAGANENTTISFSKPVMIEGKKLVAGTYGFHTIPSKNEWIIIFSNDAKEWGSYKYKQERDALRVTVKPQANALQEKLVYTIDKADNKKAKAVLAWEKLKIAFTIENVE